MNQKDTLIKARVRDAWIAAPEKLYTKEAGVSIEARLVLMYMLDLARRPGWTIFLSQILCAVGLRRDRWRRIRRELESAGYYHALRRRAGGGKWEWDHLLTYPAEPGGGCTIVGSANDGAAAAGQGDGKRSTTAPITTTRRSREAKTASPSQEKNGRRRRESGIVTWDADDTAHAEILENRYPSEILSAAVAEVAAQTNKNLNPKSPTPGPVEVAAEQIIKRRTAAAAEAEKIARREERLAAARKKPAPDFSHFEAALGRAGRFRDAILHSIYQANGTPTAWVPRQEWGLSETDAESIRATIPDRSLDPPS